MKDIVKEYGGGLFALAVDENIEERLLTELRLLRDVMNERYLHLLTTPEISKAERVNLAAEALDGRVHPYLSNFVKIMVEHGSARELLRCFTEFERLYYERHGIIKAKVESAAPLSDRQKNALTEKLEAHTSRKIELECRTVPELIGGIRLSFDNRLIDDSAREKLNRITKSLSGVVL